MARRDAGAAAEAGRARATVRARHRRPRAGAHRAARRGLHRPPHEEARALGRADFGRGKARGRPLLAVPGRQARAARVVHQRPKGRRPGRPRAMRSQRPAATGQRASRRGPRRSVRAKELFANRHPQARAAGGVQPGSDRRSTSRGEGSDRSSPGWGGGSPQG